MKYCMFAVLALFCSNIAMAEDTTTLPAYTVLNLDYPDSGRYMQLSAATKSKTGEFTKMPAGIKDKPVFKEDWLTANKMHKYLGIGSLSLALLAAIAPKPPKDKPDDGNHKALAEGAAVLGGAAVATGLMFHYDDIFDYGASDPDNLHATYATLGAIGFAMAVSDAPAAQHVGYGVLGAVLMGIGIKYTW